MGIEYAVDYSAIDPVKKQYQQFGRETLKSFYQPGFSELEGCRGESAHVIETPLGYVGSTIEGLGTRNKIAEEIEETTGISHFYAIGWSSVAVIANDLSTSGIPPFAFFMYLAAGANEMFRKEKRFHDFGVGWTNACIHLHAIYGGGETPMNRDVIFPDTVDIAGFAWGFLPKPQRPIESKNIRAGDKILGIGSSGIHDNGHTLCRDIRAKRLREEGYQTVIPSGQTFGQALLQPTLLYGPLVNACMEAGIEIHSIVNNTGHGWAKLARATAALEYKIDALPGPHPIFGFIQKRANLSDAEMYYKFNMGMGYAFILPEESAMLAQRYADDLGFSSWIIGTVRDSPDGKKRVVLPNGVVFTEKDVALR